MSSSAVHKVVVQRSVNLLIPPTQKNLGGVFYKNVTVEPPVERNSSTIVKTIGCCHSNRSFKNKNHSVGERC